MNPKRFLRLVIWELEEYWGFPVLELVTFAMVFFVLNQAAIPAEPEISYQSLMFTTGSISLFLVFIATAVFARSFAGSLSKGETKRLLSYPVKRWSVLLSKFVTNFLALSAVLAAVYSLNILLLALSPTEPVFYVALISLLLQLMFLCTVTMALSLAVRNEVMSVLVSILLLFGFDAVTRDSEYLSFFRRHQLLFTFFEQQTHGLTPDVIFEDVVMAVSFPVLVSASLLILSLIYFHHVMQID